MSTWRDLDLAVSPEIARVILGGLMLATDAVCQVAERSDDPEAARRMSRLCAAMCEVIAEVEYQTGEDRDSFGEELAEMMKQCR